MWYSLDLQCTPKTHVLKACSPGGEALESLEGGLHGRSSGHRDVSQETDNGTPTLPILLLHFLTIK